MTAIVIPACDHKPQNRKDLLDLLSCIDSKKWSKVIVCFDGCNDEFVEFFLEKFPFIHSIWNESKSVGFSINSNKGLRFCRDDLNDGCFLINQDCIIPENLELVVGEGLATPETINLENLEFEEIRKKLNEPRKIERKLLNNKFAFYCPYFSYELLKEVGLLDEDLKNLFSDDCYVLKTLLNGKFPVETVSVNIYHKGSHIDTKNPNWESGSGTYNQNDLNIGLMSYRLKWQIPNEIKHENMVEWVLKNRSWSENMVWK